MRVWCVWLWLWCVVCGLARLKNPCVHSTRPRVYVQKRPQVYRHHAHMCFNMCAWCRHTRGRIERTHGDVLSGHTGWGEGDGCRRQPRFSSVKQVFLTFLSILTRCWVHLLSPIFCLPKFAHIRDITCFRGSPKKPLDLTFFENGVSSIIERSALARCNVLTIRNRNTLQTICSATFAPFLSSSFYFSMTQWEGPRHKDNDHHDNDMSTTPHHTQPPNQQRRATHDMTRHHTTKITKTHTYTHMYMSVFMYMSVSFLLISHAKKHSLEHVPSMMCTVANFWPSTMVECSILDTSADMTNHTARKL